MALAASRCAVSQGFDDHLPIVRVRVSVLSRHYHWTSQFEARSNGE
jgi:hypothetical protein